MEKRAILAFIISIFIIFMWSLQKGNENRKGAKKITNKKASLLKEKERGYSKTADISNKKDILDKRDIKKDIKDVYVETPLYRCILTNYDGRLKKWILKKYYDKIGKDAKNIELIYPVKEKSLPLLFNIINGNFKFPDRKIFDVDKEDLILKGEDVKDIKFYIKGKDINILKRYIFYANSYRVDLEIRIENGMDKLLMGEAKLNWVLSKKGKNPSFSEGVAFVNNRVIRSKLNDIIKNEREYKGKILWMGFEDKYFISAIIPRAYDNTSVKFFESSGDYTGELIYPIQYIKKDIVYKYSLYLGPKEFDRLESLNVKLDKSINLGWFGIIAKPLLIILKFFYSFTRNYGVAIILLTFLIKIIFHPLSIKSFKSMKEMQRLQPMIKEIKEKYKNDKERMNKEVMELYKRYRVNPLGGCLPMLIQFPVFIALYNALLNSIELRHTPFILWIKDLSAKDPYYVTPIIMGVTMLIQQRMTPHTGDPTQEKIMYIMPIVFTIMFLNFPSGLVLYWLVNNILSIGQQYFINKKWRV